MLFLYIFAWFLCGFLPLAILVYNDGTCTVYDLIMCVLGGVFGVITLISVLYTVIAEYHYIWGSKVIWKRKLKNEQ